MKQKKQGLSIGSILFICLTAVVTAGCVFMFGIMRGGTDARLDAERVRGLLDPFRSTVQPQDQDVQPENTVRTVTVTLAPTSVHQQISVSAKPQDNPTPPPPERAHSFSITVGGLMAFQSDISDSVYSRKEKTYDFSPIVSMIRPKFSADLNVVFFPQLVNTRDQKHDDTLVPVQAVEAIRACGISNAVVGTEHILDRGEEIAAATVSALESSDIQCEGVNLNSVHQHIMKQLNGGSVAILSYTDILTPSSKIALEKQPSLLKRFDKDTARRDIQQAKAQGANCVIVCIYWGRPDSASATSSMKKTAKELSQMGADVILGARPTRVLPMEIITTIGEDGQSRDTFVAYSMGTLLTESRDKFDISGVLLHLDIRSDENGRIHFDRVEYTPTYIWKQAVSGTQQYRIVCSSEEPPEGMSDQQRDVMRRSLNRIQNVLMNSGVSMR